jgi:2-polyprenyl-3-methyl-5-hydroxy-6-metoxy-1,4-benzoquinol methylase
VDLPALAEHYDELLRSEVLNHDPGDRVDLVANRTRHLLILGLIDKLLDGPRDVIIDVGPGNGALLRLARELGFSSLIAVDHAHWDPERSFLTALDGVERVMANVNEPEFLRDIESGTADVVVTTEVLEHVFNYPWGYLRECWRLIRPGGLLAITTPNPCTFANALRLLRGESVLWNDEWFAKTPKIEGVTLAGYPFVHYREYAPSVFRNLLADLDRASILNSGFIANAPERSGPLLKAAVLTAVQRLGLADWRLVSHTQYALVRKER